MKYYKAKFEISPDGTDARDLVAALATEAGFESFEEHDGLFFGYVQVDLMDKPALDEALQDFPLMGTSVAYELSETEDKDWNETWEKEGFDPIAIGDDCIIFDAKGTLPDSNAQLQVAIDARQAFGTGTHETTQMIVEALMEMDLEGKRVLDCGCGTGILSIIAKKRGAREVVGYDIDDWSVNNSMHNAALNHVEIEVLEGDKNVLSHVNGLFDVILANLNRNILLSDLPAFAEIRERSCTLIISGFYEPDVDVLVEKAREVGFGDAKKKTANDWCCLIFQ
ncbi:MAG: 50S ribosomal protein L11 methyltransferase [Prevotella sp.]|nr:50S ribosomal protein L11 methyltransferase [Prevotella sp.]